MSTTTTPCTTIPLWRPLHRRLGEALLLALTRQMARTASDWHQRLRQSAGRCVEATLACRDWRELAHLDEHTLRDIGAPDGVVMRARERLEDSSRGYERFDPWRGV
jgi:hypothetical protein